MRPRARRLLIMRPTVTSDWILPGHRRWSSVVVWSPTSATNHRESSPRHDEQCALHGDHMRRMTAGEGQHRRRCGYPEVRPLGLPNAQNLHVSSFHGGGGTAIGAHDWVVEAPTGMSAQRRRAPKGWGVRPELPDAHTLTHRGSEDRVACRLPRSGFVGPGAS